MSIHDELNKLVQKYGSDNEEALVEHLKNEFSKEYKLAVEDLKNDGSDDPDMEVTAGRIADHIKDKKDKFLNECEKVLKNP